MLINTLIIILQIVFVFRYSYVTSIYIRINNIVLHTHTYTHTLTHTNYIIQTL